MLFGEHAESPIPGFWVCVLGLFVLYWSLFSNCSMAQFKARRFSFAAANCGTEAVDRIRREDQLPDSPHFSADDRTREGLTWKLMQ